MNVLTRKLIAKEFYVNRWLILGAIVAGLTGLVIAAEGAMRFNVGMLMWLTTVVAAGVCLAMIGIVSERKERALQFVLSLPLSHASYVRTKLLGQLLCFFVLWLVLCGGAVVLVLARPNLPDGLLPEAILLSGFMLANFVLVLCGALLMRSEALMTMLIIITNMGISLFIFLVGALPELRDHLQDPQPTWNSTFWMVLGIEAALLLLLCLIPWLVAARRRDFI